MKDYYRILEISPSASVEVIKASYRALAKNIIQTHKPVRTWEKQWLILMRLMKPCLTLRAGKSMTNSTAVLLTAQNRVKKGFRK